jgi:hypothetical protein
VLLTKPALFKEAKIISKYFTEIFSSKAIVDKDTLCSDGWLAKKIKARKP